MEAIVRVRHSETCPKKSDPYWRRCNCPKWIYIARERKFFSAKTRSWERAEKKSRELENSTKREVFGLSVDDAVKDYLADKKQSNVSPEWYDKLEHVFSKLLCTWCEKQGVSSLSDLDVDRLREFRATLNGNALTRSKRQEMLRAFFGYYLNHGVIRTNPAKMLSRIKVDRIPTDYFRPEEMEKILQSVSEYHPRGEGTETKRKRARAMVLLLRWSGLRLGDAARLERSRLAGNKLFLYQSKTGEPVWVPLPPNVAAELHALENANKRYFFWSGNGDPKTTVDDWWRTLSCIFKRAALGKRAHAHMFRDTFAVELLLAGVPIEQVSMLLGHSSIKITESHYAPWVKARQEQLEKSVAASWLS